MIFRTPVLQGFCSFWTKKQYIQTAPWYLTAVLQGFCSNQDLYSTRYIFATFDRNVNTYVPFEESQVGNTRSTIIANDISLHNVAVSGIVSAFRTSSVKEVGWEPLTLLSISMSDRIRTREYLGLLITILHSGVLMDGNLRAVPVLWHVPYSPNAGWL